MGRISVPPVTDALKLFKKDSNVSTLRGVARQLHENYGLTLRLGYVKLHEANTGQIQQALLDNDLAPRAFALVFDDVATWFKGNRQNGQEYQFEVRDLMAISARKINLSRDLDLVVKMQQIIDNAAVYKDLGIKVVFSGKELPVLGQNPAGKADLLVRLRSFCGPKEITIQHILDKMDTLSTRATYAIEDIALWP